MGALPHFSERQCWREGGGDVGAGKVWSPRLRKYRAGHLAWGVDELVVGESETACGSLLPGLQ